MDHDDIRALYDQRYVAAYDERFLTGPPWAALGSGYEVELIDELLPVDRRGWLDVACGTGWFLSQFPDAERAGLDLSPAMVAATRRENPGIEVVEGSYLDPHPEWVDRWSLVSCMWFAYAYVETVDQVEQVFANLARWTAPDGACFVPVCDLVDLSGGIDVPYRNDETWTFGGPLRIVAFVWSWTDEVHGKDHRNLVCPHLGHLVTVMGRWFAEVEIVHYPPLQPGWGGRRALVGRHKREAEGVGPEVVVTERIEPYRGEIPEPDGTSDPETGPEAASAEPEPEAARVEADESGGPSPAQSTAEQVPAAALPPDRQGRLWRAWSRTPLGVRRQIRRMWSITPRSFRSSVAARLSDGASSGD